MHTNLLKDYLIAMILIESILEVTKSLLHNYIMSNNVTKLQERAKCLHCIARDITFDSGQVHLQLIQLVIRKIELTIWMCFHEGLRIITCPLLESLALGKPLQITKWCGNGNTVLSSELEGEKKNWLTNDQYHLVFTVLLPDHV
jgi:hypothetical protein